MRYRPFGRTGFEVSEISLGTVEIGMPYGIAENGNAPMPEEAASARLLNYALDQGINYIDTARAYGESEAIIGRALRHRRREFVLASKVLSHHGEDLPETQLRDLIAGSVTESLRLLQTDYIDVMMIHSRAAEVTQSDTIVHVLQEFKQQGKIRSIGASVYGEEASLAAIEHGGFDCLQIAYSLLDRRSETQVFALAQQADVGLVARSVLLKGALTERYQHLPNGLHKLKAVIQQVDELARREHVTLPELAYRYAVSHTMPQTVLVGTGNIDELKQVIDFVARGQLSEGQISKVRSIPMPEANDLNPGSWPKS
jgi:aryl-alcohol dehydrogenase-like predicted oxidoreductase